jgi:hypothetical protein
MSPSVVWIIAERAKRDDFFLPTVRNQGSECTPLGQTIRSETTTSKRGRGRVSGWVVEEVTSNIEGEFVFGGFLVEDITSGSFLRFFRGHSSGEEIKTMTLPGASKESGIWSSVEL